MAGSFLSVVLFCFFLTEPRMSFQTYAVGYPVTFVIMLMLMRTGGNSCRKTKKACKVIGTAGILNAGII